MNVQQMHLAIQQGVDKINSLQADMLLPEEIDIELNKSQIRFINTKYGKNNKYNTGFEESQKRIDDLRTLIREYENSVSFKETLRDNPNLKIEVDTFTLPPDYMYMINHQASVWKEKNCQSVKHSLSTIFDTEYFVMSLDEFVCNNSNGTSTAFVDSIVMYDTPSTAPVGVNATLWQNPGFVYPSDIEQVKEDIIKNASIGFNVYWEQYGNLFYPGSFIVVASTATWGWWNWDPSVGEVTELVALDSNNSVITTTPKTRAKFSSTAIERKRYPVKENKVVKRTVQCKYVQQDDIFTLLNDPFNTTKHSSPLTTIRGRSIDVYTNDIFIIDTIKLTYLREPSKISLSLGLSCELPEHCHQEIVDMTVSSILEGISDPRYKSHQLEVSKNE
tara:strand:+ start:888 stop:2054 length:1167 start_codon:yes stop_codon:yes gene_type:complete